MALDAKGSADAARIAAQMLHRERMAYWERMAALWREYGDEPRRDETGREGSSDEGAK